MTTMTTNQKRTWKNFNKLMRGARLFDFGKQLIQRPRMQANVNQATTMKQMRRHINAENEITDGVDIELPALKRRQLLPSGSHQAPNPEEAGDDYDSLTGLVSNSMMEGETLGHVFQKRMADNKRDAKREIVPISGNIYRYWALGGFFGGIFSDDVEHFMRKTFGMLACATIQFVAPLAVIISTMFSIDWTHVAIGTSPWYSRTHKEEFGVSHLLARILGLIFIVAYTLWALEKLQGERQDWLKLKSLFNIYEAQQTGRTSGYCKTSAAKFFLNVGPAINCLTYCNCLIAMALLLKLSESPKDVVFDSLSLLFLIKLDDMDSDLGLLSADDWSKAEMGTFVYESIMGFSDTLPGDELGLADASGFFLDNTRFPDGDPRCDLDDKDEEGNLFIDFDGINVDEPESLTRGVTDNHPCYIFTIPFLKLLIFLGLLFWFFVKDVKETEAVQAEATKEAVQEELNNLKVQIAGLVSQVVGIEGKLTLPSPVPQ